MSANQVDADARRSKLCNMTTNSPHSSPRGVAKITRLTSQSSHKLQHRSSTKPRTRSTLASSCLAYCLTLAVLLQVSHNSINQHIAEAISIKPADFERLIMMPCYSGVSSSPSSISVGTFGSGLNQTGSYGSFGAGYMQRGGDSFGRGPSSAGQQDYGSAASGGYMGGYYGPMITSSSSSNPYDPSSPFSPGQRVPRANTIDNFIALVSKIEASNPRLANQPDQLIRALLNRFRMDNYYYDSRNRIGIADPDVRVDYIQPALLDAESMGGQSALDSSGPNFFIEQLLNQDEKCSMYFMLSHFIYKTGTSNIPLVGMPVAQLTGPQGGQRPPYLQAAGSNYPSSSANMAFSGSSGASAISGSGGSRYPGPSPAFGSPDTKNMNSFGVGVSNTPEYSGNNPYGSNSPQPNPMQSLQSQRPSASYITRDSTSQTGNNLAKYSTVYVDAGQSSRSSSLFEDKLAYEFGVVNVGGQENSAVVLNRVLMGILAASSPSRTLEQLARLVHPNQPISSTPKMNEEIDPLFGVTLADLWAISSIPKPGKLNELKTSLNFDGHWNNTMCPTSFRLERSQTGPFTTAELLGGLDGYNLGIFMRRLIQGSRNGRLIRLSELLRVYYGKPTMRPQFSDLSVCSRGVPLSTSGEELVRQTENYLRLYQLHLPTTDNDIAKAILNSYRFRDLLRQAPSLGAGDICQGDPYDSYASASASAGVPGSPPSSPSSSSMEQCEIAKSDLITVLDTSSQGNDMYMNLVVTKLAKRLGLSQGGSSITIVTNQQDSTGMAGPNSFNPIVTSSNNTAEIGCALMYDTTRQLAGIQVTDPVKLMEMFERALISLDSEYVQRQISYGQTRPSSSGWWWWSTESPTFVSTLGNSFGYSGYSGANSAARTKSDVGGSKVIVWFNFGETPKQQAVGTGQTDFFGKPSYFEQNQYRFTEAKNLLRENFRSASILAVTNNVEDVKTFVYDPDRDIFPDTPSPYDSSNAYQMGDSSAYAGLSAPADQLVNRLLNRMCDIPAVFQYPECFRRKSEGQSLNGYISPGKKQYWMMAPKTFYASQSITLLFKVDGGRLRVCFGRQPKPDETARYGQQQYGSSAISFASSSQSSSSSSSNPSSSSIYSGPGSQSSSFLSSSSGNYYTGRDYGVCKDVSPGQMIDFVIDTPCYHRSISECEPFYFVVSETSGFGEGDPNYMCRDEGCRRFDQVKFTMTHTGVTCSSAVRMAKENWILLTIASIVSFVSSTNQRDIAGYMNSIRRLGHSVHVIFAVLLSIGCIIPNAEAQCDFGQPREGEMRGSFTPSQVGSIVLLAMVVLAACILTCGFCYYVVKRRQNRAAQTSLPQDDYD